LIDETLYWLEFLIEAGLMSESRLTELMQETDEVVAMTVASIKTLRRSKTANRKSAIRNRKSEEWLWLVQK
jgi:hypothetical protein